MSKTKKLFMIGTFLLSPFYEACVTKVVITESQYSATARVVEVSKPVTNTVVRYQSPPVIKTVPSTNNKVKQPPKRKKKAIPTRTGPKKRPKKRAKKKTKLKRSKKYIEMQNKRKCKRKRKKCRRRVKK